MFVDAANGDFHICLGSPCCDAGNNSAAGIPGNDFEGDNRIVDGTWPQDGDAVVDMGADELLCEIAARFGNVNAAGSDLVNVLLVDDGSTGPSFGDNKRIYNTTPGPNVTMTMDPSPAGPDPADFVLYVIPIEPGIADMADQPFGIGTSSFPMPLSNGNVQPPPFTVVNTIGYKKTLGWPLLPGNPAPCTVFSYPMTTGIYTFQGCIFDNGSAGYGVSLTNAIVVKVQ
jgi:hypothetical protein